LNNAAGDTRWKQWGH